jgi:hypothetical protein
MRDKGIADVQLRKGAGVAVIAARTARLLLAALGLLALATSVSAQEGACEWRFNVGDHLIASKDGSDLGVVIRRAEKHPFSSGAIGCAYIIRTASSGRYNFDDARPASALNQIAKVAPPPPECSWRFNVGDFIVNRNNGMELGVVVRREPRYRFPNGEVRCAYFMRTGPGPETSKWDAAAIDRIGARP